MLGIIGGIVIGTLFFGSCVAAIIISVADACGQAVGEKSIYPEEADEIINI